MGNEHISRAAAVAIADYAADEHPYEKLGSSNSSEYNEGWNDACDYIRDKLENEPAADVAPVVRCKNCRYSNFDPEYGKRWCDRCLSCMLVRDDDFCSYGERMEPDHEISGS